MTAPTDLPRREGALLLSCLGIRPNGLASAPPPTLTMSDSVELLRQAGENGITPLLYHCLTTVAPAPVLPAAVLDHLRQAAVRGAAQSLRIGHELAEILALFRRHGVPVILLKGAHLGHVVYGSPALRTMGDLDLMVPREQLALAEGLLGQLGYTPQYDPLAEQVDYAHHHHTRPLGKPGALRIDLHWSITRPSMPFTVDLDGIWRRAVPVRVAGGDALALSAEDLLLHLCLHTAFDHQFRLGLRACWDVLQVVRHYGDTIDWDVAVERARQWGIGRYVYLTLRLVRELLAADIPLGRIAVLEPPGFTPEVLAWARTCVFNTETDAASVSPSMAELWTSRRLAAKLGVLRQTFYPPRSAMGRIYRTSPDTSWIYLYYPVRWVDLLVRYGRHAWGLWRGDDRVHDELRAVAERTALREWLVS
jgi:hypothetical protein